MARHRIHSIAFKKQVVQEVRRWATLSGLAAWAATCDPMVGWTRGPLFQFHLRSAGQGERDKLQPCLRGPLLSSFLRLSEGFQPCRLFVGLDGSALRVDGLLRHRRELSLRARALF